jgi:hypothetical protein
MGLLARSWLHVQGTGMSCIGLDRHVPEIHSLFSAAHVVHIQYYKAAFIFEKTNFAISVDMYAIYHTVSPIFFLSQQVNTTTSGENCADWSLFTPPSELLVLSSGLHKNVCRNPVWDANGPWCIYPSVGVSCPG